jgi:tetratricopeptide (TPR) repeat protein
LKGHEYAKNGEWGFREEMFRRGCEERWGPARAAAFRAAREERDQRPVSLALRRWAAAARAQGKLVEALDRYQQAHEIARDSLDVQGAAEAAIGAGNVLERQGGWEDAEAWYRRALDAL